MAFTSLPSRRLASLDALRGFDMLWIIGGGSLSIALAKVTGWGWLEWWARQQEHVAWEGFRFEDLIFPLFMFVSGAAIPFAMFGRIEQGVSRQSLVVKVVRRGLLLVVLGFVYSGILNFQFSDPPFRFASVLGQIGLAYLGASLIVLFTRTTAARVAWLATILIGYAVVQLFVPVPGIGAGVLTPEGCINGYIDRMLLPGRLYGGSFDPEGLLCIVSATGITLMGVLAGELLRNENLTQRRKVAVLIAAGVAGILLALVIEPRYPVIKAAWTTTFNLLAGGISCLLLALFYLVIDVWGCERWAFFFRVIGMNSITIYLGSRFIDFGHMSESLLGGVMRLSGDWSQVVFWVGVLAAKWLFLYVLYRQKLFLRV